MNSTLMPYDITLMEEALKVAALGRFTCSPNPCVGCIIAKGDRILGAGFHKKKGSPHAEIYALQAAGSSAEGATVYVTLEPCCTIGMTPECSTALINANVSRVIIAAEDPSSNASGKGIEALKQAGITVISGVLKEAAENLNLPFFKRIQSGRPFIRIKMASSLDGRIAMPSGESQWITSPESRQDVQILRASTDAILTTSETILKDNPRLTVRWETLPEAVKNLYDTKLRKQPLRLVIDTKQRVTKKCAIFKEPGQTIMIHTNESIPQQQALGKTEKIFTKATPTGFIDFKKFFSFLGQQNINSVLVEAGAHLCSALIKENLVDELIIYQAPKFLGNEAQPIFISNKKNLSDAQNFILHSVSQMGPDIKLSFKLTSSI